MTRSNEEPSATRGPEDAETAVASAGDSTAKRRSEPSAERAAQTAIDSTYETSARGEHRYPDAHQTPAERKARNDRDLLKRKWRGGQ